ncbi:hypothetical protein F3Y22_tig00111689pilonHSYRG00015 [Hibiscus syriacus]|uniref:E3 ubiquitin-protein ligase RMA n=1 Tax=Hibiscus syriacus TaxID=106335 RepID=A0A6A2Y3H4_HIBSY|nr:hypothetical protein F3Y22_tig00111689pilonHSYRG00015 [Hibiscus syriacus]
MAMDPNSFEQEGHSGLEIIRSSTNGIRWLHLRTSSLDAEQPERNCPVCKANISSSSLVPLYGRGPSLDFPPKDRQSDLVIPPRPPPFGSNPMTTSSHPREQHDENLFHSQSQSFHHQQYVPHPHGGNETLASSSLGGIAMTNFFNPMFGMLGEMVYARLSGSSNTSMFTYPYQSSHPFLNNNLRMRRQEMQVDKSLSRVTSSFVFCCFESIDFGLCILVKR